MMRKWIFIMGWLIFTCVSGEAQSCEKHFVESLKDVYGHHAVKYRKKAGRVYKRQARSPIEATSRNVILIPVVYYAKEIQKKKSVGIDEYFCMVDCGSMQFNSSLILTQNDIFLLTPSVTKKYVLLPYTHSFAIRRLVAEVQRIQPDMIFTVCNTDVIFFVKGEQVSVFDTKEGIIVERTPALLKIISDPLRFRYIK